MESHTSQVDSDMALANQLAAHLIGLEKQKADLVDQPNLDLAQHKRMMTSRATREFNVCQGIMKNTCDDISGGSKGTARRNK